MRSLLLIACCCLLPACQGGKLDSPAHRLAGTWTSTFNGTIVDILAEDDTSGIFIVHGRVNTFGSSMVASYMIASGPMFPFFFSPVAVTPAGALFAGMLDEKLLISSSASSRNVITASPSATAVTVPAAVAHTGVP